jgi:hypothetical protein
MKILWLIEAVWQRAYWRPVLKQVPPWRSQKLAAAFVQGFG